MLILQISEGGKPCDLGWWTSLHNVEDWQER